MKKIILFSLIFLVFSPAQAKITNQGYIEAVTCVGPSGEPLLQKVSFYVPTKDFFDQDTPEDFIALMSVNVNTVTVLASIEANVKNMTRDGSPIFTFKFNKTKIVFNTESKTAVFVDNHNKENISCKFTLIKNISKMSRP